MTISLIFNSHNTPFTAAIQLRIEDIRRKPIENLNFDALILDFSTNESNEP